MSWVIVVVALSSFIVVVWSQTVYKIVQNTSHLHISTSSKRIDHQILEHCVFGLTIFE